MNKEDIINLRLWQPTCHMPQPWTDCNNAHCWVLSKCLQTSNLNTSEQVSNLYIDLMRHFCNAKNKDGLLQDAFNYLKSNLTLQNRKLLKIPDELWKVWTVHSMLLYIIVP